MRKPTKKDLILLSIVLALYIAFLVWVRSWMGIIVIPFIIDNYTTKFIPWGWWKKSDNKVVRTIMSWVDAIVFALVAVYFVNLFFFQNYVIPSSSLEKSLLVGDYLFVSKMNYGARKPQTPLSLPLTQHTNPLTGGKSYSDCVQWDYERVKGWENIEKGDIVVFNYPAGDTATTNPQIIDYYAECYYIGENLYPNNVVMDSLPAERQRAVYDLYYNAGSKYIQEHPEEFGEKLWRPVDRRENYVKRCVGLPGETLEIKEKEIYINGTKSVAPKNVQFNYWVEFTAPIPERLRRKLSISIDDLQRNYGGRTLLPLTAESLAELKKYSRLVKSIEPYNHNDSRGIYPLNGNTHWTLDNYGPVWIPKRGDSIALTLENLPVYERAIAVYEGNKLETKGEKIFINGKESASYTFKMDYYWMMGDNRHNSADSRCWGFVPEDHIVGKPILIWMSLDKDRSLFDGKIRWNRLFRFVDSYK